MCLDGTVNPPHLAADCPWCAEVGVLVPYTTFGENHERSIAGELTNAIYHHLRGNQHIADYLAGNAFAVAIRRRLISATRGPMMCSTSCGGPHAAPADLTAPAPPRPLSTP